MDWTKIGTALLLIAMLAIIYPRMRHAMKHSRKGTNKEWMGFVMIIGIIALFIMFLIQLV